VLTSRSRFAWAHDDDPDRSIGATVQTPPGASFVVSKAHAPGSVLTTASIERKWIDNWLIGATFEGDIEIHQQLCREGRVRYQW
jgi:hypothetical protein